MSAQHRIGARWEQKRWSAGWMSAAMTIIPRLRVFLQEKPAVGGSNRGFPIYREKKAYGRPGVAIPDGVVPAENGFPNAPLTGVRAPVPAVMV